jgi:nucleotide-binding universal stress UspA family protein
MLLAAEENADEAGGPGLATGRPDRLPRKPASPIRRADHIGDSITTTALPWTRKRMSHASSAGERWVERCSASDSMAAGYGSASGHAGVGADGGDLTEPPSDSQTMGDLRDRLVPAARQAGERAAKILSRRWPVVDTFVTQGDPQVEIVRVAEARRVDLTVVGARGLGPRKRLFVGSTSLAVVRYAPRPVAIVRGRPRPVRHVLVPVDGSEGSRAALRFLSSFQLLRDTRVSLLHVLQRPAVPGLHRLFTSLPDQQRGEGRRTQQATPRRCWRVPPQYWRKLDLQSSNWWWTEIRHKRS